MKKLMDILKNVIDFLRTTPKVVYFVILVYFLQGIIHNLGHPVTPALVNNMGIEKQYFGYYFAAMSFGLLVGAPLWGYLGDKGNKRVYIVVGLLVYSLGQYLFAFASDKNMMIVWRFMSGLGVSASIPLLMSHLIAHSSFDRRRIYLGWYQGVFVLGSSIGYRIGGELTELSFFTDLLHTSDYKNIFLIQAILNVVHAAYIFFLIGKPIQNYQVNTEPKQSIVRRLKSIKKMPSNLLVFFLSLTLVSLGTITISKFIEVYMSDFGFSPRDIGYFVGITGIVSLFTTIFIVPIVSKLNRDFPFMLLIQLLSAVIIFIVFREENIMIALYTLFMLYVILKTLYTPLEQSYIASHASEENLGTVMGIRQSFVSIGLVLGPLLGGFLYDYKPLYAFDFSAIMLLLSFVLILVVGRNLKINGNLKKNLGK